MKQITCPSGLAFDIEKQTCDWKGKVTNCNRLDSKWRYHWIRGEGWECELYITKKINKKKIYFLKNHTKQINVNCVYIFYVNVCYIPTKENKLSSLKDLWAKHR